jgi:hypothetical protein
MHTHTRNIHVKCVCCHGSTIYNTCVFFNISLVTVLLNILLDTCPNILAKCVIKFMSSIWYDHDRQCI